MKKQKLNNVENSTPTDETIQGQSPTDLGTGDLPVNSEDVPEPSSVPYINVFRGLNKDKKGGSLGLNGNTQSFTETDVQQNTANRLDLIQPADVPTSEPIATRPGDSLGKTGEKFVNGYADIEGLNPESWIDFRDYNNYFKGKNISTIDVDYLNYERAKNQSGWEQAVNSVGRIGINLIPEITKQVANIFTPWKDYEENKATEISKRMTEIQNENSEDLAIYRENPGKVLDVTDPAWWYENVVAGGGTSALAFIALGWATAGVINPLFTKGAQVIKGAGALRAGNGLDDIRNIKEAIQLGNTARKATDLSSTIARTIILNQAEAGSVAISTYDRRYQKALEDINLDEQYNDLTKEQKEDMAKKDASIAASNSILINRTNFFLNLTSVARFNNPLISTRNLLQREGIGKTFRGIIGESAQEYAEETINYIAEESQVQGTDDYAKLAMSIEGIESGFIGALTGAMQTAGTDVIKYVPLRNNKTYNTSYNNKLRELIGKGVEVGDADKQAAEFALKEAGTDKKRVSTVQQNNYRYDRQQEQLAELREKFSLPEVKNVPILVESLGAITDFQDERLLAELKGDTTALENFKTRDFANTVLTSLENGTAGELIDILKGLQNVSQAEAVQYGLAVDESDTAYKTRLKDAVEDTIKLENEYIKSGAYLNQNEVFANRLRAYEFQKRADLVYTNFDSLLKDVQERYELSDEIFNLQEGTATRTSPTRNRLDLRRLPKSDIAFRDTAEYEYIKKERANIKFIESVLSNLHNEYKALTTDEYQQSIKEVVYRAKEQENKAIAEEKLLKKRSKVSKTQVKDIQDAQKQVVERVQNEQPGVEAPVANNETIYKNNKLYINGVEVDTSLKDNSLRGLINSVVDSDIPIQEKVDRLIKMRNVVSEKVNEINGLPMSQEEKNIALSNFEGKGLLDTYIEALSNSVNIPESETSIDLQNKDVNNIVDTLNDVDNDNNTNDENIDLQVEQEILNTNPKNVNTNTDFDLNSHVGKVQDIINLLDGRGINTNNYTEFMSALSDIVGKDKLKDSVKTITDVYNYIKDTENSTGLSMLLSQDEINAINDILNKVNNSIDSYEYWTEQHEQESNIGVELTTKETLESGIEADILSGRKPISVLGHNKIAWSARDYSGKTTKIDKDNTNNAKALDIRLLSNLEGFKENDVIEFVPLKEHSYIDSKGNLVTVTMDMGVEKAPIAISVNGEIVKGAFLHTPDWINEDNILGDESKGISIDMQRELLRNIRSTILTSPDKRYSSSILSITEGVINTTANNEKRLLSDVEGNLEIGVIRNGKVFTGNDTIANVTNSVNKDKNLVLRNGTTVVLVPTNKGKKAVVVNKTKLSSEVVDTAIFAITAYLSKGIESANNASDANQIIQFLLSGVASNRALESLAQAGYDVSTRVGLTSYLNLFFHTNTKNQLATPVFQDYLKTLPNGVSMVRVTNNGVEFGDNKSFNFMNFKKSENATEQNNGFLAALRKHLRQTYINTSTDHINSDKNVPIVSTDGNIVRNYNMYNDYLSEKLLTNILPITLDSGEVVYNVQKSIVFDTNTIRDIDLDTINTSSLGMPDDVQTELPLNTEVSLQEQLKDAKLNLERLSNNPLTTPIEISQAQARVNEIQDRIDGIITGGVIGNNTNTIITPNGDVLSENDLDFDDYANFNLTNIDDLSKVNISVADQDYNSDYNFIKGVPLSLQSNIIQTISSRVLTGALDTGEITSIDAEIRNLFNEIRVRRDFISQTNKSGKESAIRVANAILDNKNKLTEKIKAHLNTVNTLQTANKRAIDGKIKGSKDSLQSQNSRLDENGLEEDYNNNEEYDNVTGIEDVEDTEDTALRADDSFMSINPISTTSTKVKNLLTNIVTGNITIENGKQVINPKKDLVTGLPQVVPFEDVFNTLKRLLSTNNEQYIPPTFDDMMNRLRQDIKAKPYLLDVINQLEEQDESVKSAFVSNFYSQYTNSYIIEETYNKDDKALQYKVIGSDYRNADRGLIQDWYNNFKVSGNFVISRGKSTIKQSVKNDLNKKLESLSNKDTNTITYSDMLELLSPLGMEINELMFNDLKERGYKDQFLGNMVNNSDGLINIMVKKAINNSDLDKEYLFGDGAFTEFAKIVNRYTEQPYNNSHKSAGGKSQYSYTVPRNAIRRLTELKNNVTKGAELINDPFSGVTIESISGTYHPLKWIEQLYTTDNEGNVILRKESNLYKALKYGTPAGYKGRGRKAKDIDRLNEVEYERFKIANFINRGNIIGKTKIATYLFPTMSDKKVPISIQAPAFDFKLKIYDFNGQSYALPLRDESGKKGHDTLLFEALIVPEITRILTHDEALINGTLTDIDGWNKGGGKFLMYPFLNSIESLFDIHRDNKGVIISKTLKKDILTNPSLQNTMKRALVQSLLTEVANKKALWEDTEIIERNTDGKYEFKNIDGSVETSKIYGVDEFVFNYIANYHVANMNMQQMIIGDPALYYSEKGLSAIKKQLDTAIINSQDTDENNEEIARLNTDYEYAINTGSIIETFDNQGKRLAADNSSGSVVLTEEPNVKVRILPDSKKGTRIKEYLEKLLDAKDLEDFNSINEADAAEYTTLKEHLLWLYSEAVITKDIMDEANRIYGEGEPVLDYLNDNHIPLLPRKPVYSHNFTRFDDPIGVVSRTYIKSASIPLIKELTAGSELDDLRKYMDDGNADRTAFESAVKVGLPSKEKYSDGNNFVMTIPREGHVVQQQVPHNEYKSYINDGTQQSKLRFVNIMNTKGFIDPETGKKVNGRKLYERYISYYEGLFKRKYDKLINDLGYNPEDKSLDLKKVSKRLIEEGLTRGYLENELIQFQYEDSTGNLRVPLWLVSNEGKTQSLLNSIVDNAVRKRKPRGMTNVLMSEYGISAKGISGMRGIAWLGESLSELKPQREINGKIIGAQLLVPFPYFDNDGNRLKVEDFMTNGKLDTARIDSKLLEGAVFRIPTAAMSYTHYVEIVGFLPTGYNDIVVAPREFVVTMGSDFDVDKLYQNLYNEVYDKETGILSVLTADNSYLVPNKDTEKLIYENKILDIHIAVLSNPSVDVQRQVYTSADNEEFKILTRFGDEYAVSKSRRSDYWTANSESHQTFKYLNARNGKDGTATFALTNAFVATVQTVDEKNFPLYFYRETTDGVKKINYKLGGRTGNNFNNTKTVKGTLKSDVIKALLSMAVDNEKLQLMDKLNINQYTFDFINASVMLGFSEDIIIPFINHPAVIEFVTNKQRGKSGYGTRALDYLDYIQRSTEENINPERLASEITAKELHRIAKEESVDNLSEEEILSILALFDKISKAGNVVRQLQSTTNADSSGIGKNIFYSQAKQRQLIDLPEVNVLNAEKLIGDYLEYTNNIEYIEAKVEGKKQAWLKTKEEEGYIRLEGLGNKNNFTRKYLVKPTTINGLASMYAVVTNNNIWQDLFPYNGVKFTNALKTVKALVNKRTNEDFLSNINAEAEFTKQIANAYKSFIASNTFSLSGDYQNVADARTELLMDTETNESLGTVIHKMIKDNKLDNLLLKKLIIGDGKDFSSEGFYPTKITYNSSATESVSEELVTQAIIELITANKNVGTYNSKVWTTTDIAKALINYEYLTGGVQKANQFIKHIPVKYLEAIGFYDKMKEGFENANIEAFVMQFIQHNPDKFIANLNEDDVVNVDISSDVIHRDEARMENLDLAYVVDTENGVKIYIEGEGGSFYEVDKLGEGDLLEYDYNNKVGKTQYFINEASSDLGYKTLTTRPLVEDVIERVDDDSQLGLFDTFADTSPDKRIVVRSALLDETRTEVNIGSKVAYNGNEYILWKVNSAGKSQLIGLDGKKFSGTPLTNKLTSMGSYPIVSHTNGTDYIVTDSDLISTATGAVVFDDFSDTSQAQREYIYDLARQDVESFVQLPNVNDMEAVEEFLNRLSVPVEPFDAVRLNEKGRGLVDKYGIKNNDTSFTISSIADNTNNAVVKLIANELKSLTPILDSISIIIDPNLKAKAVTEFSREIGQAYQIRINPENFGSETDFQNTLIEEFTHAIMKVQISKGGDTVVRLRSLYGDIREKVLNQYGKDKFDKMIAKVKKGTVLDAGIESDILYGVYDLQEFITHSIKNEKFQKLLVDTKDREINNKSLWSRLIDAILDTLSKLGIGKSTALEYALHDIISIFNSTQIEEYQDINDVMFNNGVFIRDIQFLQQRFNLVNDEGEYLGKANATEIANFINRTVFNVLAVEKDGAVLMSYINRDGSLNSNFDLTAEQQAFVDDLYAQGNIADTNNDINTQFQSANYKRTLKDRLRDYDRLISTIKAEEPNNPKDLQSKHNRLFAAIKEQNEIKNALEIEQGKWIDAGQKPMANLLELHTRGEAELESISKILAKPMTDSHIIYANRVLNFWNNSRKLIFDEANYNVPEQNIPFVELEDRARALKNDLLKKSKEYLQEYFLNKKINSDLTVDDIMDGFKDVNKITANVGDWSTLDNRLLSAASVVLKETEIETREELENVFGNIDDLIQKTYPILTSINRSKPYDIFIQRRDNGKRTRQLINRYSYDYQKELKQALASMYKTGGETGAIGLVNWHNLTNKNINLLSIFPSDGNITEEVQAARDNLKAELGALHYTDYMIRQGKKLEKYALEKEAARVTIAEARELELEDFTNNTDAVEELNRWTNANSPYQFNNIGKSDTKGINYFGVHQYMEFIPLAEIEGKSTGYYDNNYKTIESNSSLYALHKEFENLLTEMLYYLPENKRRQIMNGGLPEIEKGLIEVMTDRGVKLGFKAVFDKLQEATRGIEVPQNIDVATGNVENILDANIGKTKYAEIEAEIAREIIKKKLELNRELEDSEIYNIESDVYDKHADTGTFDMGKVLKMFAVGAIGYKHKSKIENSIKIMQDVINSYVEQVRDGKGNYVYAPDGTVQTKSSTADSFKNTKELMNYSVNRLIYGTGYDQKLGDKVYTNEEKAIIADIDKMIEDLGSIDYNSEADRIKAKEQGIPFSGDGEINDVIAQLNKQKDKLGKRGDFNKKGDLALQYVQLKGMGWNLPGGISNMLFGFVSNSIEGSGRQIYTNSELMQAYKLVMNNVIKNVTGGYIVSDVATKISLGMQKLDILKESANELYQNSYKGGMKSKLKYLHPYAIQQRTEYMNQAPLFVVMAKKAKVETKAGEISIWDGYNANWEWDIAKYGAEPKEAINKLKMKVDQLVKRNHGNYDPTSPIMVKRHLAGRALLQFRTWMIDSLRNRFGDARGNDGNRAGRFDDILEIYVKGRYVSAWDSISDDFKDGKYGRTVLALTQEVLKKFIPNVGGLKDYRNSWNALDKLKSGNSNLTDTDIANLSRTASELAMAIIVFSLLAGLKGLVGELDDDEKWVVNSLINQGIRVRTDLVMYVNPVEGRKLFKDPFPVVQILDDARNLTKALQDTAMGEGVYTTGVYEGDSKLAHKLGNAIPLVSGVYRSYKSSQSIFD